MFDFVFRWEDDSEVDRVLEVAWQIGNMMIVIEEADWLASTSTIHPMIKKMIKKGRHRQISLAAVSRRPAELSRLLTSQADEIVSFKMTEPADLDYMKHCGFDPEVLQNLSEHAHVSNQKPKEN